MSPEFPPNRPMSIEERYRLYLDESGDHMFRRLDLPAHRYLCLLGCWFRGGDYLAFHREFESLKQEHMPHSPDDPVIFHRKEILSAGGAFWRLREPSRREAFDFDLVELLRAARFRIVAVVIDKKRLIERYPTPAHPYHLGLGFMLQRYCGFLNHFNRCGDVLAESRGGTEDRLLKDSYRRIYQRGVWMTPASFFQAALASSQLKVKPKSANVAGIQLADLLGHPVKQMVLLQVGASSAPLTPFVETLMRAVEGKLNRHLYDGRVEGYGWVLFPRGE